MNHQGAIPVKREQYLPRSCPCSSEPLSKAGACFVYFSGEFDSCGSTQNSTQKQCLRKQQRYGWTDSKRSGGSRHITVKTYSCLSETLGNLQQITGWLVRASGWDLLFLSCSGPGWKEGLGEWRGLTTCPRLRVTWGEIQLMLAETEQAAIAGKTAGNSGRA